jgi:hypothetical protein
MKKYRFSAAAAGRLGWTAAVLAVAMALAGTAAAAERMVLLEEFTATW